MSDVAVHHPGLGQQATVPEESLPHLRVSGWLLLSEHQQNEAEAAEREAAASKPSVKKESGQ